MPATPAPAWGAYDSPEGAGAGVSRRKSREPAPRLHTGMILAALFGPRTTYGCSQWHDALPSSWHAQVATSPSRQLSPHSLNSPSPVSQTA